VEKESDCETRRRGPWFHLEGLPFYVFLRRNSGCGAQADESAYTLAMIGGKTIVMALAGQSWRHEPQCQHSSG